MWIIQLNNRSERVEKPCYVATGGPLAGYTHNPARAQRYRTESDARAVACPMTEAPISLNQLIYFHPKG